MRTKKGRLGMLAPTRRHVFEGGGAQARMRTKSAQAPSEVVCGSTGTLAVLIRWRCGLLVRAEGLRGRRACVERRGGGSNTCRRAVAAAVLGRARSLRAVLLVASRQLAVRSGLAGIKVLAARLLPRARP